MSSRYANTASPSRRLAWTAGCANPDALQGSMQLMLHVASHAAATPAPMSIPAAPLPPPHTHKRHQMYPELASAGRCSLDVGSVEAGGGLCAGLTSASARSAGCSRSRLTYCVAPSVLFVASRKPRLAHTPAFGSRRTHADTTRLSGRLSSNAWAKWRKQMQRTLGRSHPYRPSTTVGSACSQPSARHRQPTGQHARHPLPQSAASKL